MKTPSGPPGRYVILSPVPPIASPRALHGGLIPLIPLPRADDWGDLFWHLAQQVQRKKIVLVLDEISWMGSKDPTFLGKLKTAWDLYFKNNPQVVLIQNELYF